MSPPTPVRVLPSHLSAVFSLHWTFTPTPWCPQQTCMVLSGAEKREGAGRGGPSLCDSVTVSVTH